MSGKPLLYARLKGPHVPPSTIRQALLAILCCALITAVAAAAVLTPTPSTSLTTKEHLQQAPWWPTKSLPDHSRFAGPEACASCHAGIARTQRTTEMARTLTPALAAAPLSLHSGPIFTYGAYHYAIQRSPSAVTLLISDALHKDAEPLEWAFGSGEVGQSYMSQKQGAFYESRFNYFSGIHAFDRTPGRLRDAPVTFDTAQGRKLTAFEARSCFACHTGALTSAEPLTRAQFQPGITCEACHGPGLEHVAAMKSSPSNAPHIVNPASLTPTQAVDFCGSCHGTPRDVELMGAVGPPTVRFPAYRLVESRCWAGQGDARLTCFACHDPHRPLARDPVAYDDKCLSCHATGASAAASTANHPTVCPVAKSRCTTCHMPKVNVAEMHTDFTDHDIRIVKPNAPFPDGQP